MCLARPPKTEPLLGLHLLPFRPRVVACGAPFDKAGPKKKCREPLFLGGEMDVVQDGPKQVIK